MEKFQDHFPIFIARSYFTETEGHVYNSQIRSVLFDVCKTRSINIKDVNRFTRNEHMITRWICSIKLSNNILIVNLRLTLTAAL